MPPFADLPKIDNWGLRTEAMQVSYLLTEQVAEIQIRNVGLWWLSLILPTLRPFNSPSRSVVDISNMPESRAITEMSQVAPDLIRKLITGSHVLDHHKLVDAYGHISVRLSDSTFLMSRYLAPALVSSADDLVIYKVEDGEPVYPNAPRSMS